MHVYHYNHTERTALQRLTIDHGVAELTLAEMVADGVFVDLFPVVKGAVQIGAESYGLKDVERLTEYERGHDIDKGAGGRRRVRTMDVRTRPVDARPDRRATTKTTSGPPERSATGWSRHRPVGPAWRAPVIDLAEPEPELDARIEALHRFEVAGPEHSMGDLLGYWRRERRAAAADAYRLSIADADDQLASARVISGLVFQFLEDQFSEVDRQAAQVAGRRLLVSSAADRRRDRAGATVIQAFTEQNWGFYKVASIDRHARRLRVDWTATTRRRLDGRSVSSLTRRFRRAPSSTR